MKTALNKRIYLIKMWELQQNPIWNKDHMEIKSVVSFWQRLKTSSLQPTTRSATIIIS